MESYALLKYVQEYQYAEDFLAGRLFMNTLGYFWDEEKLKRPIPLADLKEDVPGQNDMLEGAYCYGDPRRLGLPDDFVDHMAADVILRAKGYRYCNLFCCCKLDYSAGNLGDGHCRIEWDETRIMKEFGKYVIIIDDVREFEKRVDRAMRRERFTYLCGSVKYRKFKHNGADVDLGHHVMLRAENYVVDVNDETLRNAVEGNFDSFSKMDTMAYQNEWRISLYRGKKDTVPYVLNLGCRLDDIAHAVMVEEMIDAVNTDFRQGKFKLEPQYKWYGNVDRGDLRKKFYALGDCQAEMLAVVGQSRKV